MPSVNSPASESQEPKHDPVAPTHYRELGEYSALHVSERWELGYHLGNALKYIQRAGKKPGESELTDLRKARWYLQRYLWLLAPDEERNPLDSDS